MELTYIEKGTKQYTRTNLALFSSGLVTFANLYLTQPLLPQFTEQFNISPATASLSLSVATGTLAFSLLLFGSISEAVGRKNLMVISMILSSILTICIAFSNTFETLLILRIIQGFIFAGVPAIAMAYLVEEMSPRQIAFTMGLYISGNSIGGLTGRIVMSMGTQFVTWQTATIILGIFSLSLSAYFIWALPPSKHFIKQPFNIKQLATALYQHITNSGLLSLYIVGFTLMGSFVTLYNYISYKLLGPDYNLSSAIVGSIFLVYLVGTFSSAWFGSLAGKLGKPRTLLTGIAIMFIGITFTFFAPLVCKISGIILFTFGFFGAHSIASGAVSTFATHHKGQASSLYLFFYYFGSSVCGSIGGLFWAKSEWNGVILFITLLLVCCVLGAMHYRKKLSAI